jgi:hypothetical protein
LSKSKFLVYIDVFVLRFYYFLLRDWVLTASASGLSKHGVDSDQPLPYCHHDIAPSACESMLFFFFFFFFFLMRSLFYFVISNFYWGYDPEAVCRWDRPLEALFLLICFDIMLSGLVMSCGFSYFVVLGSVICNLCVSFLCHAVL